MTPEPADICGLAVSGKPKKRRKKGSRSIGLSCSGERDSTAMFTTAGVTCSSSGASVGTLPSTVTGGIPANTHNGHTLHIDNSKTANARIDNEVQVENVICYPTTRRPAGEAMNRSTGAAIPAGLRADILSAVTAARAELESLVCTLVQFASLTGEEASAQDF